MTTTQITVMIILIVAMLIAFIQTMKSKRDVEKHFWGSVQFCFIFLITFMGIVAMKENETNKKKLKGKCPEYEKIENVYRLK